MKKTLKIIALSLWAVMLTLCFTVIPPMKSNTAAAENTVIYEDKFDYESFAGKTLFDGVVWQAEDPSSGNQANPDFYATTPVVADGVMKLKEGASAQFNWTKLSNINYSASRTLTLKFDVKITDFGDDKGIRDVWARELYVAPGGWYNQIEMRSDASAGNCIRAGGTWKGTAGVEYRTGVVYTIIIEWKPSENKIRSTVKNGSSTIAAGERSNSAYASSAKPMNNWVMRCEEGAIEIDNFSFSDGLNIYEQDFDFTSKPGTMVYNGYWEIESEQKTGASAPTIDSGVVKFDSKDSVSFNWTKDLKHDTTLSYWFEFDVKITDVGNGFEWGNPASTRAIYVASGGYWNHVEIPTNKNQLRLGDTYVTMDPSEYLNKDLKIRIVYEGLNVYAYLMDSTGKKLVYGVRSNSAFANVTAEDMDDLVIRCEDGAFEMDNFKFGSEKIECVASKDLDITEGKTASYSAEINYVAGSGASIKLNSTDIFSISDGGIAVCGPMITGTYDTGKYGVELFVNPDQYMVHVTVTLPDGGILQRGHHSLVGGATAFSVGVFVKGGATATEKGVSYGQITKNEYEIISTRPVRSGFDANVYNLITSFDDAATTRNFAFTAKTSYIGAGLMALKYKAKGGEWNTVTAVKETESANQDEDFYKVDLTNLTPETEYEYKIGKKDSTDEANDWSKTYSFKTASGKEEEFTFLAVGDTQGITWNGTSTSNKGFMYAEAAYTEAMEENPNPAFMMHAGDVVENGGNKDQWNMFFDALGDKGATVPHFAAIGNHDTVSVGGEFYFDLHFNHPNNGGTEKLDTTYTSQITNGNLKAMADKADETFYSYNYGDAHFIVLNTGNYSGQDQMLIEAQRKWLEADLKANACARWTVMLFHEPVYHRVGGSESRPWLYDLIEESGVDLVLQGHSHLVTRSYPMKGGKIVTKTAGDKIAQGTGTVYTTIGATALNHDSIGSPNMEEMYKIVTPKNENPSYTTVKISGDKLVMTIKQVDGFVLDTFEITADNNNPHEGEISLINVKEASCTEKGYSGDKKCLLCGKIAEKGEETEMLEHVFDQLVATDDYKDKDAACHSKTTYFKSCECGAKGTETFEQGEYALHSWNDGEVTKNPTVDEEGEKTFTCTACGETRTEKLDKIIGGDDGNQGGLEGDGGSNGEGEDSSVGCGTVVAGNGNDFTGGFMAMLTILGIAALLLKKRERN